MLLPPIFYKLAYSIVHLLSNNIGLRFVMNDRCYPQCCVLPWLPLSVRLLMSQLRGRHIIRLNRRWALLYGLSAFFLPSGVGRDWDSKMWWLFSGLLRGGYCSWGTPRFLAELTIVRSQIGYCWQLLVVTMSTNISCERISKKLLPFWHVDNVSRYLKGTLIASNEEQ
jgi:hypothetical protein